MPFRINIIPPIHVTDRDRQRRLRRFGERAGAETTIDVCELPAGPRMLYTHDDFRACDEAVMRAGLQTSPEVFDAILIDCTFDPAVDAIRAQTGLPTFGPMRTTLPLVSLVAPAFAIIAALDCHMEPLRELVHSYGYSKSLVSVCSLGKTYPSREDYPAALHEQIALASEAGAGAILLGSTTMGLTAELAPVATQIPIVLPGLVTLGMMESMWWDGLLLTLDTPVLNRTGS